MVLLLLNERISMDQTFELGEEVLVNKRKFRVIETPHHKDVYLLKEGSTGNTITVRPEQIEKIINK